MRPSLEAPVPVCTTPAAQAHYVRYLAAPLSASSGFLIFKVSWSCHLRSQSSPSVGWACCRTIKGIHHSFQLASRVCPELTVVVSFARCLGFLRLKSVLMAIYQAGSDNAHMRSVHALLKNAMDSFNSKAGFLQSPCCGFPSPLWETCLLLTPFLASVESLVCYFCAIKKTSCHYRAFKSVPYEVLWWLEGSCEKKLKGVWAYMLHC